MSIAGKQSPLASQCRPAADCPAYISSPCDSSARLPTEDAFDEVLDPVEDEDDPELDPLELLDDPALLEELELVDDVLELEALDDDEDDPALLLELDDAPDPAEEDDLGWCDYIGHAQKTPSASRA
jgi:hypothetical protein